MVEIRFSSALERVTDEQTTQVEADTVSDAIDQLRDRYGEEFEEKLIQDDELRRFVNLYVNGEDIRHGDGLQTSVEDNDEVSILPAVSGG